MAACGGRATTHAYGAATKKPRLTAHGEKRNAACAILFAPAAKFEYPLKIFSGYIMLARVRHEHDVVGKGQRIRIIITLHGVASERD